MHAALGVAIAATLCAATSSAGPAGAPGNAHLAAAEQLAADLKLREAEGELAQAWEVHGNARPDVLRILELQGVVAASLRQQAKAETFFRRLCVLDPSHVLSGDYAPRVMTPFYESRSWAAERGALSFVAQRATSTDQGIQAVGAAVRNDPFSMAQRIRFHVRPKAGPWNVLEQPLSGGHARAPIEAPQVEWWAELLGANDAQLALIGSEAAPVLEEGPKAAVASAPPPPPAPVVAAPAPGPAVAAGVEQHPAGPSLRPAAYGLMAAGIAALGAGGYFGARSAGDLSKIHDAARDGTGTVTGLSQRDAFALNQDSKTSALAANVLFGAGAGLALTGAALWFLGRDSAPPPVAWSVGVAPSGVVVQGALPW